MPQDLNQLLAVVQPQPSAELSFVGTNMHPQSQRLYGGQVLAQCVSAAVATVPPSRELHSQHAYFLRPGRPSEPVQLEVEKARDGWSFSSRRVVASQLGKPILVSSLSFQEPVEGEEFQTPMPSVAAPDCWISERERALQRGKFDEDFQVTTGLDLDVRMAVGPDWGLDMPQLPELAVWMRVNGAVEAGLGLHQALLAYMSDAFLIDVCLATRGMIDGRRRWQVASLDHALWFHAPFRADQWLLHHVHTLRMSGGRGLAQGSFYSENGTLVATTTQQGLMRHSEKQ